MPLSSHDELATSTSDMARATPIACPIDLDEIGRFGARLYGSPIVRVVLIQSDGRRQALDLPLVGDQEAKVGLSPTQRRILELLSASSVPLARKSIARKFGRDDAKGKFGSEIRELVSMGLVFESGGKLTDAPEKFQQEING